MDSQVNFTLKKTDGKARLGMWHLGHGDVPTPAFMPVGTVGSVKTLAPWEVVPLSENILLCNTYHLMVRPGTEHVRRFGGLHRWIGWNGNILTDSGGFQLFSLAPLRKIDNEGVIFQSHLDGARLKMTPESVVDAQMDLGSDVMMVLDECTAFPATVDVAGKSMRLSMDWAERAWRHFSERRAERPQILMGIQQGSVVRSLREESSERLRALDMDGYAIGGLSVGEPKELMNDTLSYAPSLLPEHKVRYLMGVGKPEDLVEAVCQGVDVFDCVLPTRNARNGGIFLTFGGSANIKNARFREEKGPIDPMCDCRACKGFSASFIQHLYKSDEVLALRLLTEHNLFYLRRLMEQMRAAIRDGCFAVFREEFRRRQDVSMLGSHLNLQ